MFESVLIKKLILIVSSASVRRQNVSLINQQDWFSEKISIRCSVSTYLIKQHVIHIRFTRRNAKALTLFKANNISDSLKDITADKQTAV